MLLTGRNRVHDLLSLLLVVNFKGKEVLWSSQLELGNIALLVVFNDDFFCGYSPERINPGDKINTLINIKKVTTKKVATKKSTTKKAS